MPIVVRVVSQDDYSRWVGQQKKAAAAAADEPGKPRDELVARGEAK
jgi:cytochrome c oxidase subunit 2